MNKPALKAKKHWYDYLWIASLLYLFLGFFNIMFAWLGLICFLVPLAISIATGSKLYCNRYCGRGQLFSILGKKLHLSPNREIPGWMKSKAFRYGFLVFFLVMFCQMLFNTYLVFRGTSGLKQAVTVLPALAARLSRHRPSPVDRPVCLWLLQRHADLHHFRFGHHGPVPPPLLVRLLPHGYYDPDDMQGKGGSVPWRGIRMRDLRLQFFGLRFFRLKRISFMTLQTVRSHAAAPLYLSSFDKIQEIVYTIRIYIITPCI